MLRLLPDLRPLCLLFRLAHYVHADQLGERSQQLAHDRTRAAIADGTAVHNCDRGNKGRRRDEEHLVGVVDVVRLKRLLGGRDALLRGQFEHGVA